LRKLPKYSNVLYNYVEVTAVVFQQTRERGLKMTKRSQLMRGPVTAAQTNKKIYLFTLLTAVFALTLAVPICMVGCLETLPTDPTDPTVQSPAGIVITGPVLVTKHGRGEFEVRFTDAKGKPLDTPDRVKWTIAFGPGSITPEGVYTPPENLTETTFVTLKATTYDSEASLVAQRDLIISPVTRTLTALTIQGPEDVFAGERLTFTAQATFEGGETEDVTDQAEWSLSGPGTLNANVYTAPDDLDPEAEITITVRYTEPGGMDVGDLGILAANYGTTEGATEAMGDFNGDGMVDVSDLAILAANYTVSKTASKTLQSPIVQGKILIGLSLAGVEALPAGGVASYTLTANYSDATSVDVTNQAAWSIASGPGTLASNNYTAPAAVTADTPVQMQASFGGKSTQKELTVAGLTVSPTSLLWNASDNTEKTITLASTGSTVIEYVISDVPIWLSVPALTGAVDSAGQDIPVTLGDRASMNPGENQDPMKITPKIGSITGTPISVTATLLVAAISANAAELTFAPGTTSLPLEVWNSGAGTLVYSAGTGVPWLTVTPATGTSTGEHDTLTVSVDRTGLDPAQTYSATLTVSSDQPGIASLTISVTLKAAQAPTANAGPDQTLIDSDSNGSEVVTLDGSGSSASSGSIINYRWTEGETVLYDGTGPTIKIDALETGKHTFTLTVTDNNGFLSTDTVHIVVKVNSNAIAVWAYPDSNTVTGTVNIGVVAYHSTSIERVEFQVDDGTLITVSKETLNPETQEYEFVFSLNTTKLLNGSHNIQAIAIPRAGLSTYLPNLQIQVANDVMFNTWYVDSINGDDLTGTGTVLKPFASINKACTVANGGDTVICRAGSYAFPNGNYNFCNYLTIKAHENEEATIPDGGQCNSSYMKIVGLVFTFSDNQNIYISSNANHVWFRDCLFIGMGRDNPNNQGPAVAGSTSAHHIIFENNEVHDKDEGATLPGKGRYILRNNRIHHQTGTPFKYDGDHILISNNQLHDLHLPPGSTGHMDFLSSNSGVSNLVIRNNLCYEQDGMGLKFGGFSDKDYNGTNVAIVNNLFSTPQQGSIVFRLQYKFDAGGVYVFKNWLVANNTFWHPDGGIVRNVMLLNYIPNDTPVGLENFVFVNNILGEYTVADYSELVNNGYAWIDYNKYNQGVATGAHSSMGWPGFIDVASNNFDLLNNSTCIEAGTPKVGIRYDLQWQSRSAIAPTLGAFEGER
jgi:hypothetical protein